MVVLVRAGANTGDAVDIDTVLREVLSNGSLVVGVLVLLLNLIKGQFELMKHCFPKDFVDKTVGLRELVLPEFGIAYPPVLKVEISHQLYK